MRIFEYVFNAGFNAVGILSGNLKKINTCALLIADQAGLFGVGAGYPEISFAVNGKLLGRGYSGFGYFGPAAGLTVTINVTISDNINLSGLVRSYGFAGFCLLPMVAE